MNNVKIYSLFIVLLLGSLSVSAQKERKHIRQGNRDYNKAIIDSVTVDTTLYQNAEVDYRKALDKDPNNWDAQYNLANALYKQAKFEEAARQFEAVAGMDNENKESIALAYHNLGNTLLQSQKLEPAIEAYKNSLRNNPSDFDTKYNLAWAQEKLKQQQEQEQNQDQNKDQDKNEDQEQDKEQEQDQDKKDEQQDKQDQDQQKQDQQEQQQDQQEQQQQEQKISKEDAMRILEALQNDEKEVQEKVQKQKAKPVKVKTEKDW